MATLAEPNPVTTIIGIGPAIAQKLKAREIEFDRDLLTRPSLIQAHLLADIEGLTAASVLTSVLPQARLLRLPLMTGELANALTKLNYDSYAKVSLTDAETIANQLNELADTGSIVLAPDIDTIRGWQLAAAEMAASGSMRVTVRTADRAPIGDATVEVNGTGHTDVATPITTITDRRGHAFFENLAPTTHAFRVGAPGHKSRVIVGVVKQLSHSRIEVSLVAGEHVPELIDEFAGGLVFDSPTFVIVEETVSLGELEPVPPMFVREIGATNAILASLWRRRVDDTIVIPHVSIPLSELPTNLALRDVLVADRSGTFVIQSGVKPEKFRAEFVAARASELFERIPQ